MKSFSAQYIFTNAGPVLKRAIITASDDGTVINVEDTGGTLPERRSVEFHNGIIVPGFVNCHCHLELSCLHGSVPEGLGLPEFIRHIRSFRENSTGNIDEAIASGDEQMLSEGIVLCGDICNTSDTFKIKKSGRIRYISLIEVFGIDPEKAGLRMSQAKKVSEEADLVGIPWWFVPHSAYSLSLNLFRMLRDSSSANKVTSVHFMESPSEKEFLSTGRGSLIESYKASGLITTGLRNVKGHVSAVLEEITPSGNLILVHNTFADRDTVEVVKERGSLFWCICPRSNMYIEKKLPPVSMLKEEGCEIVIGTDSMASNHSLSILAELKLLQDSFPAIGLNELIRWASLNGSRALDEEKLFGSIEPGKKPGLLLLRDADIINMKLLPETSVTRLL
ncbi:MAG: amidohydrolase family protein [Bacteroidales bacterium]